jgi:hypothetical protein
MSYHVSRFQRFLLKSVGDLEKPSLAAILINSAILILRIFHARFFFSFYLNINEYASNIAQKTQGAKISVF